MNGVMLLLVLAPIVWGVFLVCLSIRAWSVLGKLGRRLDWEEAQTRAHNAQHPDDYANQMAAQGYVFENGTWVRRNV